MVAKTDDDLLQALKDKELRFQAYMANTREAIWRIDMTPPMSMTLPEEQMIYCIFHNTIITEANDSMAKMYGLSEGREVVGRPLSDFMEATIDDNISSAQEFVREKFLIQDAITHERKVDGTKGVFLNNITPSFSGGSLLYFWGSSLEITEICNLQEELNKTNRKLEHKKQSLEEKNIALKELITQISMERESLKAQVLRNVETVLLPALDKIEMTKGDPRHIEQFRRDLGDLTSSFGHTLMSGKEKLTPREIEVCRLVKNGLSNKEISSFLNVSIHTVEKHRRTVRKKLGLSNKSINLQTFLSG